MSFRRDREPELAWRHWVQSHETELLALGIPREVWADRMTWWGFLENGIHPDVSNARDVRFRLTDLSPEQQQRLYRFLDLVLPEQRAGVVVWWVLNHQFGNETDNRE